MIRLDGRAAAYGELWYDEPAPAGGGVDILVHRWRSRPLPGARSQALASLQTDLAPAPAELQKQLASGCRYEVRRAESRDALQAHFLGEPRHHLDEFADFFDAFARQKSQPPCDRHWLAAACAAGRLELSAAMRAGETLVWHALVRAGNVVGLQYSASCFRDRDDDYRALVGRANRWLHWRELLRFRESGFRCYDWGGVFEDESLPEHLGINRFKRSFGGRPVRAWDCTAPVSLRGRLYLPLRDAWRAAQQRKAA